MQYNSISITSLIHRPQISLWNRKMRGSNPEADVYISGSRDLAV